jgi:hypothetical protein
MTTEGEIQNDESGFTAEEQAQFDAMRSPGSNASDPSETLAPDPAKIEAPAAETTTAPVDPDLSDPDVETLKDASGKDVIDAATGKPQKRVSFHKFQRLQNQFKELEGKLANTAEERARIDERLKIISEALATPPPADPSTQVDDDPEPDMEGNIFEWAKWSKRQNQNLAESFNQFKEATTQREQDVAMADTYRQDANRFARTEAHFGASYHFLLNLRANQLRAAGWNDETKISQQIVKEEKGLVRTALDEGVSPAQRIFEMAKSAGFTPKPVAAPPAPVVPGTPLGQKPAAAAPAPAAGGVPSVSEQVALAAKGTEAATSLSNTGGAPMEQLTSAKLLSMPEEEFDAVVATLSKAKLRELFGD